jgi:hypothetical protein
MEILFLIILALIHSIVLFFLLRSFVKIKGAFELLIVQFVEQSKEMLEMSEKNFDKIKDTIIIQNELTKEISIIRRYAESINTSSKILTETIRGLNQSTKILSDSTKELKVSKDIAKNLSEVSGNLKILDSILKSVTSKRS